MKTIRIVVKKTFRDRYTGIKHVPGDKLTVTDARYREIKRSGDYIQLDKPTSLVETKSETKAENKKVK